MGIMNEQGVNGENEYNEGCVYVTPKTTQIWVYILIGKSRITWSSPRSSCNHFSQLKQLWVNKIL